MQLQAVPRLETIDPKVFRNEYYTPQKPVVIRILQGTGLPITNGIGIISSNWWASNV
jgi:hypothetical protein